MLHWWGIIDHLSAALMYYSWNNYYNDTQSDTYYVPHNLTLMYHSAQATQILEGL